MFFLGSADSGIADQTEMSSEMRVLQEVMDTETVYVADLEEVIEVRISIHSEIGTDTNTSTKLSCFNCMICKTKDDVN